jgi:N-acetylmuramoyl-L-alanine amidase
MVAENSSLKMWTTLMLAILTAVALASVAFSSGVAAQETGCQVVLDAGHGGSDSGAVNSNGL